MNNLSLCHCHHFLSQPGANAADTMLETLQLKAQKLCVTAGLKHCCLFFLTGESWW